MYSMSSQALANYSNQSASLRSTLGSAMARGTEIENDRKAFMQEMLQNSSQYSKEKAMEAGGKVFANTGPGGFLIKTFTGKDPTPLKTAAKAAAKKLEDVKSGVDEEGLAALRERSQLAGETDLASLQKDQAARAVSAAQDKVEALPDASERSLQALTEKSSALSDAQDTARQTAAELDRASQVPPQGFSPPDLQALTEAQQADKAAQAEVASKQSDLDTATAARTTASEAESGLADAAGKAEGAASAFKEASEAESAAKDAADAARAARIVKVGKGVKDAEEVAAGAEESGNPIGLVVGVIGAIIAGVLGSRVKVHEAVAPEKVQISQLASYSATPGA